MTRFLDLQDFAKGSIAENPANLYFLLDHGGLPGLYRQLARTSTTWVSLFEGTAEVNSLAVAPILVLAGSDGAVRLPLGLCKWISESGTYSSSLMMLSSPLEIGQLKDRLKARLNVCISGDMDAMLRFFDPRVFESLMGVLDAEQAKVFLSVARKWWYVDRSGAIRSVDSMFNDVASADEALNLSASQEFALVDSCEPDQVLNGLRENASSYLENLDVARQYEFVVSNINEAKSFGLRSLNDLILYNVAVLTVGKSPANESQWSNLMNAVEMEPSKFSELVMCLEGGAVTEGVK
ncbi:DUF4123 domain-containing protein [Massilia sp. CT11-108]|jgi:hypothetical protein|uniref:DUF4123 domain-containing protein n=1 Tax=Massilia sp. CT11-108 TaxID=3393900 RepID=UPI0039A717D5